MFSLLDSLSSTELQQALAARAAPVTADLHATIMDVYARAEADGVQAILDYTRRFDCEPFDEHAVFIDDGFVEACVRDLTPALRHAIEIAVSNIRAVNDKIVAHTIGWDHEIGPGHVVGERVYPLESALLWVPARKAPLISTAIMLCVAACAAGVPRIVVGTPPDSDGRPDRNTIAAARLAGATNFVCGNGLAVIAAGATGRWPHGKVHAIFGPGPQAIAQSMLRAATYGVATQPGVGPSDSLIIFGELDEPEARILARDFLTEIEHGSDSYTYALTTDRTAAERLHKALETALERSFGRHDIYAEVAESMQAAIIILEDQQEIVHFANDFGAEHLMIYDEQEQARAYENAIKTAGEILVGKSTPFVAANYCIGVTAVLPTNGFARSYSGITARNFLRFSSRASLDARALETLVPTIESIGAAENLPNHVEGAKVRRV